MGLKRAGERQKGRKMTTARPVLPKWPSGYPRIVLKAHHILIYKEGLAFFNPWRNQRLKSPWSEIHDLLHSVLDHSHRQHSQPNRAVTIFMFWSIFHWSSTLMLFVTLMLNALHNYNSSTGRIQTQKCVLLISTLLHQHPQFS